MNTILMLLFYFIYLCASNKIVRESSIHDTLGHYVKGLEALKDQTHEVVVAIKQNNLDILESILYDVSTPGSGKYGKHLSFDEIGNLVGNRIGANIVCDWLKANNITIKYQSYFGEYIIASAKVSTWENLFDTKFHEYHPLQKLTSNFMKPLKSVIRASSYSLPEEINPHIHSIFRLTNLPPIKAFTSKIRKIDENEVKGISHHNLYNISSSAHMNSATDTYVTPHNLKSAYEITGTGLGLGSQTIYASLEQTFLPSDLSYFQYYYSIQNTPVSHYHGLIPDNSVCYSSSTNYNCVEASLDVQYITAIGEDVPTTYFYDPGDDNDFVNFIVNVSSLSNPTYVYSISYGAYEVSLTKDEISAFNYEAMKLGARGVTIVAASGDDGITGFLFRDGTEPISHCGYYATWPASSPYVTAIGGTMGGMETSGDRSSEIVCSVLTGSSITSGGGFSNSISAPTFQKTAIASYNSKYTPKQSYYQKYNTNNRGYPDLAMAANLYVVVIDQTFYGIDGTSASAPTFAGLVSLVNSIKISQGESTLGWLNPTIYSNNGGFTNDITSGNNDCTANSKYCCSFGFKAVEGWDPITGFGSVNYNRFLTYYLNLVYTKNPTVYPTSLSTKKPTSIPTYRPTKYPTWYPTPIKTEHYIISFTIIQSFNTFVTSQQLSNDILSQREFEKAVSTIFEDFHPSYVKYLNSYNVLKNDLVINYLLVFDIYELYNMNNITNMLYNNISSWYNYSISSDIFDTVLLSSSSNIVNQLSTQVIPQISQPVISFSNGTPLDKSTKSHSTISYVIYAVIVGIVGFILMLILYYKCNKKEFQLVSSQSNHSDHTNTLERSYHADADIELSKIPPSPLSPPPNVPPEGWNLTGLLAKSYNPLTNTIRKT